MTLYSVFDRPAAPDPVAVPDRFSWFAALLPPVYLVRHGLWLGLLGYIVAILALAALALVVGDNAVSWLYIFIAALFGFEASALRRGKLRRGGRTLETERFAAGADLAVVDWLRAVRTR